MLPYKSSSTLVKVSRKTLLIFFSLLFVVGVLIRIFISPILWPDVPEIVEPLRIILSSAMVFLMLSVIYYLKVRGSPKQFRVFWIVSLGLCIGFPFSVVGVLIFKALLGRSPDILFPLLYFIGVAIGAVIGNWVGKKRYTGWQVQDRTEVEMDIKRKEKLRWWRRFWPQIIIACSVLIVVQCITHLSGYIDLSQLCRGILVVFVAIPLAYGVRYLQIRYQYQTMKKMQLIRKIVVIGFFASMAWFITFFGVAFIIWATGLPPPTDYLGPWPTFILLFIVPPIVGGFIGYRLEKRLNFRPYI